MPKFKIKFSLPMHEEDRQRLYAAAELEQRDVHLWARRLLLDAADEILEKNALSKMQVQRQAEPEMIPSAQHFDPSYTLKPRDAPTLEPQRPASVPVTAELRGDDQKFWYLYDGKGEAAWDLNGKRIA